MTEVAAATGWNTSPHLRRRLGRLIGLGGAQAPEPGPGVTEDVRSLQQPRPERPYRGAAGAGERQAPPTRLPRKKGRRGRGREGGGRAEEGSHGLAVPGAGAGEPEGEGFCSR
jgi:hypothetical protein